MKKLFPVGTIVPEISLVDENIVTCFHDFNKFRDKTWVLNYDSNASLDPMKRPDIGMISADPRSGFIV